MRHLIKYVIITVFAIIFVSFLLQDYLLDFEILYYIFVALLIFCTEVFAKWGFNKYVISIFKSKKAPVSRQIIAISNVSISIAAIITGYQIGIEFGINFFEDFQPPLERINNFKIFIAILFFISLIAARITSCERWSHVLGPACFGMGICLLGTGIVAQLESTFQWIILLVTLLGAGAFGGIFLIPLTTFVQVRPKDSQKGKVIAAANFCAFSGMLIAGKLFTLFDAAFQPSRNMIILGGTGIVCALLFFFGSTFANRYEKNATLESKHV